MCQAPPCNGRVSGSPRVTDSPLHGVPSTTHVRHTGRTPTHVSYTGGVHHTCPLPGRAPHMPATQMARHKSPLHRRRPHTCPLHGEFPPRMSVTRGASVTHRAPTTCQPPLDHRPSVFIGRRTPRRGREPSDPSDAKNIFSNHASRAADKNTRSLELHGNNVIPRRRTDSWQNVVRRTLFCSHTCLQALGNDESLNLWKCEIIHRHPWERTPTLVPQINKMRPCAL
jgi:hypothetical protein